MFFVSLDFMLGFSSFFAAATKHAKCVPRPPPQSIYVFLLRFWREWRRRWGRRWRGGGRLRCWRAKSSREDRNPLPSHSHGESAGQWRLANCAPSGAATRSPLVQPRGLRGRLPGRCQAAQLLPHQLHQRQNALRETFGEFSA